ncbi:hypothetical protein N5C72_07655 [Achromobacter mucicolens]|uniref:Uncharacterized protein n=1 Tax=Achromobacter mucicolens TaxID=1389922 RepID=A0ABD4YRN8_9BURK|nr:hypothetical protein [Achromobacter mucicolens]MDH1177945.1 hypothetical protein [Achromobacter mucicolens]
MKIRTLRRRQARLSRGEYSYLDRYLGRASRRRLEAAMANLLQAARKVSAFLSKRAYAKRFS